MSSSFSSGLQQCLYWVFALFCCFTSAHAPPLSSLIHLQITLPKVCLQDRVHTLYYVSFPGQSILSPHSHSNNSYKTFWHLLILMNLPDFSRPLHLDQSCFFAWKVSSSFCYHWDSSHLRSLSGHWTHTCLMMGLSQMQMSLLWNSMTAPSDH